MITAQQTLRLQQAIARWSKTPYVAGQFQPGLGIDCVRYCWGVLNEAFFETWDHGTALPREAQDAALHNTEVSKKVARLFIEKFDLYSLEPRRTPMASDILSVKAKLPGVQTVNPVHLILVGMNGIKCHHAVPGLGIADTGIGGVRASYDITHIYRSRLAYAKG